MDGFGAGFLIGLIIVVLIAIWAFSVSAQEQRQRGSLEETLKSISGFVPTYLLASPVKAIALDQAGKRIAIAFLHQNKIETRVFPYALITGVDIERENGASLTQKTGFVSFTTQTTLSELTLRVTFCDQEIPLFRIPLYVRLVPSNSTTGVMDPQARQAVEQANQWHGLISSILRAGDTKQSTGENGKGSSGEIVEKIEALHRMHLDGVLSEVEYQAAKARLLSL